MRVNALDNVADECAIQDILAEETYLAFGPETLAEARNRCYHLCRHCHPAGEADDSTSSAFALRAPVSGSVIERSARLGQMLDPAAPAFRIGDLSTLWLTVHAFERDAVRIENGAAARIVFPALPGQANSAGHRRNSTPSLRWCRSRDDRSGPPSFRGPLWRAAPPD